VPLIDLLDDPAGVIERIILSTYTDDTLALDLFHDLRTQLVTNLLVHRDFRRTQSAGPSSSNEDAIRSIRKVTG